MGAMLCCFSAVEKPPLQPNPSSEALQKIRSTREENGAKELLTNEQAFAAAALLLRHSKSGGSDAVAFDRSVSVRDSKQGKRKERMSRSSSSRPRAAGDDEGQLFVDQELKIDNLETNHVVLVHGGGFGAWCWYKTITLLKDSGFRVTAVDLAGAGISFIDANKIRNLAEYVKPLTRLLESIEEGEKVIMVGHDFGGICVSYAMEMFPRKVDKAIFICAAMLKNGQNTLDMFSGEAGLNSLMKESQIFVYANGKDKPPTAIDLNKSLVNDILFNQSPAKDVSLALVSIRSIPFAPLLEKLSLSDENYGSVRRFYIETTEDNALPLSLQQNICALNPPERTFRLKGSDHSPFFSKPQALHKILVEIAKLTPSEMSQSQLPS